MTYTTLTELTLRYGAGLLLQVADRASPPAGVIDAAIVGRALADADAVIDGYLAARYALPLAATPPLVADWAQAIAIYKLHTFSPEQKIKDDYSDALRQLQSVATGTVRLPVAGIEPAGAAASGVEVTDRPRTFTPDNFCGFI